MKNMLLLLGLLSASGAMRPQKALAQCHFIYTPVYHSCHHRHDSCAVEKPFVPGRFGGYLGIMGAADQQGTPYAGLEVEGHYWLLPRWSTGLRGSITGEMPAPSAPAEVYAGASQPRLQLYSISWSNSFLVADARRWRLAVQVGAGLGGVGLYDKARQVQRKGQSCGCTTAEEIASATAPITEVGLAATYKIKGSDGPWLSLLGGYRQWNGSVPFGAVNQFSAYVLTVALTVPDAPPKHK